MKKIYLYGLMLFTVSLGLTSCSKDEHTDTKVTNYIVLLYMLIQMQHTRMLDVRQRLLDRMYLIRL